MFPRQIFRAYDIRGKVGEELTEGVMESIGRSLGTMVLERGLHSVVIGRDTRWTGPEMAAALKRGLLQTPVDVFDCGEASFGSAVYCAQHYKKDICAYVTPSHLPAEHNGLKIFYGTGLSFMAEDIAELGRRSEKGEWELGKGKDGGALDAKTPYIALVKRHFHCPNVKGVLDCGGGAACTSHPEAFRAVGIDVVELFCKKDPMLRCRDPKPSKETIGELMRTVVKAKADFGVAFDADGDRAVLVDEAGRVLSADQCAAIVGKRLLAKGPGAIVATVECSMVAEDFLGPMGANVIRVPVGHTYIMEAGKKHSALLGYEDSGHMVMPGIALFDDPTFVVLSIAEAMAREHRKLSALAAEIPNYPRQRVVVKTTEEKKFKIIDSLKRRMSAEYEHVNTMDGVRIDFGDAWVLIRASNTEPIVRVTAEAKTKPRVEELAKKFGQMLEEEAK